VTPPEEGAIFKGYQNYDAQELRTTVRRIRFFLARWELPSGKIITTPVPPEYEGTHFGPELQKHIIHQVYNNRVPQKKVYEELVDAGVEISAGQIDGIIGKKTELFSPEYNDIAKAGFTTSQQIGADETGARHQGKNGYTTVICNDLFTYLKTTKHKSRINFLMILSMEIEPRYVVNRVAFDYARDHKLSDGTQAWLEAREQRSYTEEEFEALLASIKLSESGARVIRESCLYATCIENGMPSDLVLMSDGAGQFKILVHALCWVHMVRNIKKMVPANDAERAEIERIKKLIWAYYKKLLAYKKSPSLEQKEELSAEFDKIFKQATIGTKLAPELKKFYDNKIKLLRVLDDPSLPLHNNLAERDIRHIVIKRKVSGGTRSPLGRAARDIFCSILKTCLKLGISVSAYLSDRLTQTNLIPNLGDLIRQKNAALARGPAVI
jgi:hypothetical protein